MTPRVVLTGGSAAFPIRDFLTRANVDFDYLLQTAIRESSLNPEAKAPSSSGGGGRGRGRSGATSGSGGGSHSAASFSGRR